MHVHGIGIRFTTGSSWRISVKLGCESLSHRRGFADGFSKAIVKRYCAHWHISVQVCNSREYDSVDLVVDASVDVLDNDCKQQHSREAGIDNWCFWWVRLTDQSSYLRPEDLSNLHSSYHRIGGACAKSLYGNGIHLALSYSSHRSDLDQLVNELRQNTTPAESSKNLIISIHRANMASTSDLKGLFDDIYATHSRLPDILISNAGHSKRIPNLDDISLEEFEYTIRVNLTAAFVLCQLAVPHMRRQQWGRIVMISSISAYGGGINGCHYAASKAGLLGMVKNLALKHGGEGITFNDVAPAMIGGTRLIPDAESVVDTPGDVRLIPVGRLGMPDEVANVVVMLCRTGYLTGQSILLSGGLK